MEIKDKLISVIIPAYNCEKYINKCLDSIMKQTYHELEIIIINDGSTDNTLEELKKVKDNRITIIDIENKGVSNARNLGIEKAQGEFIMFVDADDYLSSNCIEELYKEMTVNKEIDIIRFNGFVVQNKKIREIEFPVENNLILDTDKDKNKIMELIAGQKQTLRGYCWLLFMRNNNIKPFNTNLTYLEDKVFYLENFLTTSKKILFLNKCYYYYEENSSSKTKNIDKFFNNLLDIIKSTDYVIEICEKNQYDKLENVSSSCSRLILYRLDFLIQKTSYKHSKQLLKKIEENEVIHNRLFVDNVVLNKFKTIQYKLLKSKKYLLYYYITKVKNLIKR